jgi:hypothetical protein
MTGRLILAKQPQISPRIIGNDSVSVMIAQPRLARLLPTPISYYLPPACPHREHRLKAWRLCRDKVVGSPPNLWAV